MAVRIPLITDFDGRGIDKANASLHSSKAQAKKARFY